MTSEPTLTRPVAPAALTRHARRARTDQLFREMQGASGPSREALRAEIIELNLDITRSVCARYRNRGIPLEDLQQVACVGLVKAVDGYQPDAGHAFLSYAVPTMRGEVLRYFRDHGWAVRPSRPVQELQARIQAATDVLFQQLGRAPRPSDVAEHLDTDIEDVIEAMSADGCFQPASLDREQFEDGQTVGDQLVADDAHDWGSLEARVLLEPALAVLDERERHVLRRRFVDGLTQREIGAEIGVTQMHVSRILSRALARMREEIDPA